MADANEKLMQMAADLEVEMMSDMYRRCDMFSCSFVSQSLPVQNVESVSAEVYSNALQRGRADKGRGGVPGQVRRQIS